MRCIDPAVHVSIYSRLHNAQHVFLYFTNRTTILEIFPLSEVTYLLPVLSAVGVNIDFYKLIPSQSRHHFAVDIFKIIFLYENCCTLFKLVCSLLNNKASVLDNGLAPNKIYVIIRTNGGFVLLKQMCITQLRYLIPSWTKWPPFWQTTFSTAFY